MLSRIEISQIAVSKVRVKTMIDVNAKVRIRHGLRKGQLAEVIDTNFKNEKTHSSLVRYRVRFIGGDSDWYEAAALEELPKLSNTPITSKHYG